MLAKIKPCGENREVQKEQINDLNRQRKPKEQKKKVPLAVHINPLSSNSIHSSKRGHKQSKSTIEPNEQRHYNSPILNFPHDNLQPNAFSFTHILQQNLKNQQFTSVESSHSPPVTNFQIESSASFHRALQGRPSEKPS